MSFTDKLRYYELRHAARRAQSHSAPDPYDCLILAKKLHYSLRGPRCIGRHPSSAELIKQAFVIFISMMRVSVGNATGQPVRSTWALTDDQGMGAYVHTSPNPGPTSHKVSRRPMPLARSHGVGGKVTGRLCELPTRTGTCELDAVCADGTSTTTARPCDT